MDKHLVDKILRKQSFDWYFGWKFGRILKISRRMLKGRSLFGSLVVLTMILSFGCKAEKQNLIVGKWKVFHINRGGMIIGGRGFKGTEYEFRENGTVFGQGTSNSNQDTLTSKYLQRGDSLIYVSLVTQAEEAYHLDTLTESRLVISANIDGIPTKVSMMKLKK